MTSQNRSAELSAPRTAAEAFCSNLSLGIHAAAQPLAVLLAGLSKDHTDPMSTEQLRELTASSAAEVQRVCALFGCLQQLVMAESITPQLSSTPIQPLLAYVVEGVDLLFQQNGIYLSIMNRDTCRPVLINRARTLQALSRVLLIAHSVSGAGDTVELTASSCATGMEIVVRNVNSSVASINADARLSMAVAEANIRSQQGDLHWELQPFHVQIQLQKAPYAF
jgi:hypothetical protein